MLFYHRNKIYIFYFDINYIKTLLINIINVLLIYIKIKLIIIKIFFFEFNNESLFLSKL